jgi:hypothetical protein
LEKLAADAGCNVRCAVTAETTLLIIGEQDERKLAGKTASQKEIDALTRIANGQSIRQLSEADFRALLEAPVVQATPLEVAEERPVGNIAAPPPPSRARALTEKYRPRRLAELAGQADAVAVLQAYVADPYPAAFIFAGDTGVGKSSAALALAGELGCNLDSNPPEFGGVYSIPSGEHNADSLRDVWPGLWTMPFESAKGWKVLICNEVEQLNGAVEKLWLDKLEDLPPSTALVFTTNNLASLPARFVDRCIGGVLEFNASADDLIQPAQALARSIWWAETGVEISADVLEKVVKRSITAGQLSFRRIVKALVPLIAAGRKQP